VSFLDEVKDNLVGPPRHRPCFSARQYTKKDEPDRQISAADQADRTVREPLVHSGLTPEKLRTVSPVVSPTSAGLLTPTGNVSGRSYFPPTMRSNKS
jgi:hypothetical protein